MMNYIAWYEGGGEKEREREMGGGRQTDSKRERDGGRETDSKREREMGGGRQTVRERERTTCTMYMHTTCTCIPH